MQIGRKYLNSQNEPPREYITVTLMSINVCIDEKDIYNTVCPAACRLCR